MDEAEPAPERIPPLPQYPKLFRELMELHAFVAFQVAEIRVHGNVRGAEDSLEDLCADEILTHALIEAGFPPFGRPATGSYDRICFDVGAAKGKDDAPVVRMDHEAILCRNRIPKPTLISGNLLRSLELDGRQETARG